LLTDNEFKDGDSANIKECNDEKSFHGSYDIKSNVNLIIPNKHKKFNPRNGNGVSCIEYFNMCAKICAVRTARFPVGKIAKKSV